MRTYLIVLAKMRRPSTTPSARMPRSLSSRTTAAASLATSAAESTEIPTSAWWSAIASLTPSPRNATSEPRLRWARMIRDFCSGVTRAKMVVFGSSATRAASSSFSSSCPVTTVPWSRPTSPQRCAATWPLSPVTILTVIPSRASRASESLTSGLTGSVKQRKPVEGEVVLVVLAEVVGGERAACDRDDSRTRGEEAVEGRLRLGGDGRAAGKDGFRALPWRSAAGPAGCRRGPRPAVARGRRAGGRAAPETVSLCASCGAAQSARSSSLPVLSLQARPRTRTWSSGLPVPSSACVNEI